MPDQHSTGDKPEFRLIPESFAFSEVRNGSSVHFSATLLAQ